MSTRNLSAGKGRPEHKADKITDICEPIVQKLWELKRFLTTCASTAFYSDKITLFM
jgi:hypothetical protein